MLGKTTAHQVVEDACRQALARDIPLRAVLAGIPQVTEILSADTLDRLCDPRNATGLADQLIQRALAHHVE
jgi:3-carboxy-cis,cis-muconate cycloisomerase